MSSIVKSGISLSKKDLSRSRIPLVASRNVVFYHKTSGGELSINLLALSMPSEMPSQVQATVDEISGARLYTNKKNITLVSSANAELIQGLHYQITSGTTIQLIGPYLISGAEIDEIFVGTINSAPMSDLVVASARTVVKTYELAVGQNILNLGREYQTGANPNDNIGSVKLFVNGVLAHRDTDYAEVDAGSGYGTTVSFFAAPVSIPYQIAADFGVMSITDNDGLGAIEALSGAVRKIAIDLADVASTDVNDYLTANPSEIERRTFGDSVLSLLSQIVNKIEQQSIIIDVTGSGAFTGGSLKITRIGDQVVINAVSDLTHASATSSVSAAGVIPSWARPATAVANMYYLSGGNLRRFVVMTDGSFSTTYFDAAFGGIAATSENSLLSISYNV